MTKKIFISFNEENMAIANGMAQYLGESICWVAHNDIQLVNENLMSETDQKLEAILNAEYLIFILSKHTCDSKSNLEEITYAFNNKIKVITFRIEDIEPSKDFGPYLDKNMWFDAFSGKTLDHMQKLEKMISQ